MSSVLHRRRSERKALQVARMLSELDMGGRAVRSKATGRPLVTRISLARV